MIRKFKKEYYELVDSLFLHGWDDFIREAIFVDSNDGVRQIVYLAQKDDIPLVACNQIVLGAEIPIICDLVFDQIGKCIILFNTYGGVVEIREVITSRCFRDWDLEFIKIHGFVDLTPQE